MKRLPKSRASVTRRRGSDTRALSAHWPTCWKKVRRHDGPAKDGGGARERAALAAPTLEGDPASGVPRSAALEVRRRRDPVPGAGPVVVRAMAHRRHRRFDCGADPGARLATQPGAGLEALERIRKR